MNNKVTSALSDVIRATKEELSAVYFVVHLVLKMGLRWSPIEYPECYHPNMLPKRGGQLQGIWQEPEQFARALIFLSAQKRPIRKVISIGTFNGWTDAFVLTYLSRFHPISCFVSLDPYPYVAGKPDVYSFDPHIRQALDQLKLPYTHYQVDSSKIETVTLAKSDLCMIDGLHTYKAVMKDWMNVGQYAQLCWFHDINNYLVGPESVPKVWNTVIKPTYSTREFLHDKEGMDRFGIGISVAAQ